MSKKKKFGIGVLVFFGIIISIGIFGGIASSDVPPLSERIEPNKQIAEISKKSTDSLEGLSDADLRNYRILKESCENNQGYLSGMEIGKMVEEKCMDNINSKYYSKAEKARAEKGLD